jgi:hypothetical protein
MAFELKFEDQFGNVHEKSYWRLVEVAINIPNKSASFIFGGYENELARKVGGCDFVGVKQYVVLGEKFDWMWNEITNTQDAAGLGSVVYGQARRTKDIKGEDGVVHSFFDEAKNV